MKELQFKTGGRRLRIEDLEALQDGIKGASAFFSASKQDFVVTGCEVSVIKAVRNPNYNPITNAGGKAWNSIQLTITDGYVFMDGKLRKVAGKVFDITNVNEVIYLVVKDNLRNDIIYYDGTTGPQFYDYGAELIMSTNEPDVTFMLMEKNVSLKSPHDPANLTYNFPDFKTGFLSKLALPRSGGTLDNDVSLTFESIEGDAGFSVMVDGYCIKFQTISDGQSKCLLNITSNGLSFYDDNGDLTTEINNKRIVTPRLKTVFIEDNDGNAVQTDELCSFFSKLRNNVIQFDNNNIKLTWGANEDNDERYVKIEPHQITLNYDDSKAILTGYSFTVEQVNCGMLSSTDIVGTRYSVSNAFDNTTMDGLTADVPVGDKILKIVGGIVVSYDTP